MATGRGKAALIVLLLTACAGKTAPPSTPQSGSVKKPSHAAASPDLPVKLALLGGRLALHAPKGASLSPRSHSIMAADASIEDETRVILVHGDAEQARFVLLARESFVYGTGDIQADAVKYFGEDAHDYRFEPLKLGSGLSAALFRPKRRIGAQDSIMVLGAIVERADKTLAELSFHIGRDMAGETEDWVARAEKILATLEAGKATVAAVLEHKLDTGAGKVLVIKLAHPAVLTRQDGPDFYVYHLRELPDLGKQGSTIGVYIGGNPALQYSQAEVNPSQVKQSSGTLLGANVTWFTWQPAASIEISEAIAPLGGDDRVHVFVTGAPGQIPDLRRAAEGMKLVAK